jgi:hypothetical protein
MVSIIVLPRAYTLRTESWYPDLLFFDALTSAKLPMETYHTWVW